MSTLISHRDKFIFIHIYKSGGTSITETFDTFFTDLIKYKHETALEIRDIIGKKKFNSYYKFAIVRNPWDWQVFSLSLHETVQRTFSI